VTLLKSLKFWNVYFDSTTLSNGYRLSMSTVRAYGTVRRSLLYGTVLNLWISVPYFSLFFMLLIKIIHSQLWISCVIVLLLKYNNSFVVKITSASMGESCSNFIYSILFSTVHDCYSVVRYGTVRYGTVRYGTVRYVTDIWVVLLLPRIVQWCHYWIMASSDLTFYPIRARKKLFLLLSPIFQRCFFPTRS